MDKRIRSKKLFSSPSSEMVKNARQWLRLTQEEAGLIVCCTLTAWQQWESGKRKMIPGLWELFKIKTGYQG